MTQRVTPSEREKLEPKAVELVPAMVEGELCIRDLDLAERLGFEDPHKIRNLIERHKPALSRLGLSATVAESIEMTGGRPGRAYWLNRKQPVFVTAKSETAEATAITIEIIERFDAYERGAAPPPPPMFDPNDPAALWAVLLGYTEKVEGLTKENSDLKAEVAQLQWSADTSAARARSAPVFRPLPERAVEIPKGYIPSAGELFAVGKVMEIERH